MMSMPWASSFFAISGFFRTLLSSSFMRLMISGGVLDDAKTAHHAGASKPG